MNEIKIYGISISICAVFVSILINSSYAQSDNFKTYTNNDLNFTIQHPSKWEGDGTDDGVQFTIRENPEDAIEINGHKFPTYSYFLVDVEKVESQLDYNTMTLQNTSLEQYVQMAKDVMPLNSETLLRQNQVTVGGNDGVKIEYTSNEDNRDQYGFRIFTIANGKLYTLEYEDKPLKVPESLPLANKMVESFQFNR
ncbi:MAG TPA: hypothetical protein VF220_00360 [Nitrososphaeraceae archaeon]